MKFINYIILILITMIFIVLFINYYVIVTTKKQILNENSLSKDADCILVLGAAIWDNKPSPMLEDRLTKSIELYKRGISNKIIVSGDHSKKDYDEVNVMKKYIIDKNVPSEDIFMDHAGFSTYDSIYRAKEIFKAKKIIIVTQQYHLYRALYIANRLGLEAYGISAESIDYSGKTYREIREVLARNKDFVKSIIKPKPTYLGEEIPVNGNGDITNDK